MEALKIKSDWILISKTISAYKTISSAAPVNHISLKEAKAMNIAHTMLGNFCHGDKDRNCTWKIWVIMLV
jgi:hypothetical protein